MALLGVRVGDKILVVKENPRKWSKGIHVVHGGLHGYCVHCPASLRHRALQTTVRSAGYATAARRLNYIHNLSERHHPSVAAVMEQDLHWMHRMYR